jgi:branched-chain amino acid transport system substrate-binding protein
MQRQHVRLLAALAAVCCLPMLGACSREPDTLKIGVLVAQSGTFAARGKDLLRGAEMAVDEINKSGFKVNGKPVTLELVSVDDKGEVEGAKQGAQLLIDQHVGAVIGPLNTPQAAPVIPMVAQTGVPHLFTATAASLTTLGQGNTFRLLSNDDQQGRAMASFAVETLKASRIATIVEAGDYGQGLNRAFRGALKPGTPAPVVSFDVDAKGEVTPEMAQKIKDAKADLVVVFAREPQLRSLFKSLQAVSYAGIDVLGTNVVRNRGLAEKPIPVKAMYATATAIDAKEFPDGRRFLNEFRQRYKDEPVWGAHYAYDGVYALADAARRGQSLSPKSLVETLKRIEPATKVNQQMRFAQSGEQVFANIAVYKVDRGAWVPQMMSATW